MDTGMARILDYIALAYGLGFAAHVRRLIVRPKSPLLSLIVPNILTTEMPLHFMAFNFFIVYRVYQRYRKSHTNEMKLNKTTDQTQSKWQQHLRIFIMSLLGISQLGLIALWRTNRASHTPFQAALEGANVKTNLHTRSYTLRERLALLYPMYWPWARTQPLHITEGIVYAVVKKTRLKLDIYRRPSKLDETPFQPRPVLVYVHGGGWVGGNKSHHSIPLIYKLASEGWVVCTVNYRLAPRVKFPAPLKDVKRALAWVKQNIAMYGGDPACVCIGGESAGGHLSLLAALTPNDPAYQAGFEEVDTSVCGVVDVYGVRDFVDEDKEWYDGFMTFIQKVVMRKRLNLNDAETVKWFHAASPRHRLLNRIENNGHTDTGRVPPVFTVHGTHDELVPVSDARRFHNILTKIRLVEDTANLEVNAVGDAYVELYRAQHGFNMLLSPRTLAFNDAVYDFLNAIHINTRNKRPTTSDTQLQAQL